MKSEELIKYREIFLKETLDEIIQLYEETDEKVTSIIKRFGLEITPNQMASFLPAAEVDAECPYCAKPMKRKRHRKSGYVYQEDIFCDWCGHKEGGYKKCKCPNCIERERRIIAERKEIIKEYYSDIIPKEKKEYDELDFKSKSLLFILYLELKKSLNFEFIDSRLITNDRKLYFIRRLLEEKIIFVSPDSSLKAFSDVDFPSQFYADRVDYLVNVNFSEENERMIRLREFSAVNIDEEEVREFLRELAYEDLLMQFEELLGERHIDFEPSEEQLEDFKELLNIASYTQIEFICYKVAVYYSDLIVTGKAYNKKMIPRQVLASVVNFYNNGIEKYGNVYKSNPEYAGFLLRTVIEKVLEKDISILNEVI